MIGWGGGGVECHYCGFSYCLFMCAKGGGGLKTSCSVDIVNIYRAKGVFGVGG